MRRCHSRLEQERLGWQQQERAESLPHGEDSRLPSASSCCTRGTVWQPMGLGGTDCQGLKDLARRDSRTRTSKPDRTMPHHVCEQLR
jgi:hypothetical protein